MPLHSTHLAKRLRSWLDGTRAVVGGRSVTWHFLFRLFYWLRFQQAARAPKRVPDLSYTSIQILHSEFKFRTKISSPPKCRQLIATTKTLTNQPKPCQDSFTLFTYFYHTHKWTQLRSWTQKQYTIAPAKSFDSFAFDVQLHRITSHDVRENFIQTFWILRRSQFDLPSLIEVLWVTT